MPKVKTGVRRMSKEDVLQLVDNIIANATGKAELATSLVTLAQLGTLRIQGEDAMDAESLADDALDTRRTELEEKFVEIRNAVDGFAQHAGTVYKHDKAKLQAISLDVANPPTPVGPLPAPVNLRSFTGAMEETVELQWDPVHRREIYWLECAQSINGPWTLAYTGKRARTTCGNLISGTEYFFRVKAQGGTTKFSPWSGFTKKRAA
jgi:hypothetical protein